MNTNLRLYSTSPNQRHNILSFLGIFLSSLVLLFFILPTITSASCGDFVTSDGYHEPIEDCEDPFGVNTSSHYSKVDYTLGGTVLDLDNESVIQVEALPAALDLVVTTLPNQYDTYTKLVKHENGDYLVMGNNFSSGSPLVFSATGTYSLITDILVPIEEVMVTTTWLQKAKALILPTAHAAVVMIPFETERVSVTFEIKEALTTPVGASSVLFLPGIQASRLYKDGLFGTEDQLWEPNFDQDVFQLAMTETGESINDIYTKDVVDTVFGLGDIYAGFLDFLEEQKTTEKPIKDFTAFAYDWRFGVEDVAANGTKYENETKSLVEEAIRLADESYTNKVTIIAHSNGGLLAKALIRELERTGQSDLVDVLILLALPQTGTPKAIGTVLHGYDQQDNFGGFFISAATARKSINNMPAAYGLLPTEKYFADLDGPIVTFDSGTATQPYINEYGNEISNYYDYVKFIGASDSIDRDLSYKVSVPASGNRQILGEALSMHDDRLDDWVAPSNIKVVEIVGTGLPTMKSIEYRDIVEKKCASSGGGIICVDENEIKPFAHMTKYGDGTAVQKSAEAYPGDKEKYFVNLLSVRLSLLGSKYAHSNITEFTGIQSLIKALISSSTISSEFISKNYTVFDDVYDIETIDSPVRLLATDIEGNQTGVVIVDGQKTIKQDIPGSQYFEFGDTKYFIVPSSVKRTTRLYGEGYGGYTLTISSINADDSQTRVSAVTNSTTTPSLQAEYSNDGKDYSNLVTDIDGDGLVDYEMTLDGDLVQEEKEITYGTLTDSINALPLAKSRKLILLLIVRNAEKYHEKSSRHKIYQRLEDSFLDIARLTITQYDRKGYLSKSELTELDSIIKSLKDKQ